MLYNLLLIIVAAGEYDCPPTGIYAKAAQPVVRQGYPARGGQTYYVYVNGIRYRPDASHLKQGEHAGQFDHAWLDSLSQEDLLWLHSHAHLGTVNWEYAKRPAQTSLEILTKKKVIRWACINGRCGWYQFKE